MKPQMPLKAPQKPPIVVRCRLVERTTTPSCRITASSPRPFGPVQLLPRAPQIVVTVIFSTSPSVDSVTPGPLFARRSASPTCVVSISPSLHSSRTSARGSVVGAKTTGVSNDTCSDEAADLAASADVAAPISTSAAPSM